MPSIACHGRVNCHAGSRRVGWQKHEQMDLKNDFYQDNI